MAEKAQTLTAYWFQGFRVPDCPRFEAVFGKANTVETRGPFCMFGNERCAHLVEVVVSGMGNSTTCAFPEVITEAQDAG